MEISYISPSICIIKFAMAFFFVVIPENYQKVPTAFVELTVGVVVVALSFLFVVSPLTLIAFFVLQVKNTISVSQSVGHFA